MDLMEHAEVAIALVESEQRLQQAIRNISRFVQGKSIRKARTPK
jgi:hypothetical protein